jgi:hypothetical protein
VKRSSASTSRKATGHQELYFVASGHATFTLDGEEVDGPSGTLVFLGDTGTKRKAVAKEPGTTILAVGAKQGEAYEVMGLGGERRDVSRSMRRGTMQERQRSYAPRSNANLTTPGSYYNLACMEALAGHNGRGARRSLACENRGAVPRTGSRTTPIWTRSGTIRVSRSC